MLFKRDIYYSIKAYRLCNTPHEARVKGTMFYEALNNSNRLVLIVVMLMVTRSTQSIASLTVYVRSNPPSEHFKTIKRSNM